MTITMSENVPVYKHVWVINNSDKPYSEKFKGEIINIDANGRIKMTRHDAAAFRGQYPGDKVEKRLIVEPIIPKPEIKSYECEITGKVFNNLKDYKDHIKDLRKRLKDG